MIKKFEFRLNDITSEPFIYDTEEEDWEHEMEQDQIDWVISMSDYGRKELEYEIRCNNCMWTGYEEDLLLVEFNANDGEEVPTATENSFGIVTRISSPLENREFLKGCPNCKTDNYLMDF